MKRLAVLATVLAISACSGSASTSDSTRAGVIRACGDLSADIGRWTDGIRVIGFLSDDLTSDELESLREQLESWPEVDDVVFFSKAEAADEFRELFADQPTLIEVLERDPSILPASFRIRPAALADYSAIRDRLTGIEGFTQVSAADESVDRLVRFAELIGCSI